MSDPIISLCPELEAKRNAAIKKVDDAYDNCKSPHFRDNERYAWAITTINKKIYEEQIKLNQQEEQQCPE